jgi:serine phosphatase RsbU (regulator of sigma subunit)
MEKRKKAWFSVLLGLGVALGLLLLFEAIFSYRDVVGRLVTDHIKNQAGNIASAVESRISGPAFPSAEDLSRALEQARRAQPDLIAWMRVLDQQGNVLGRSERAPADPLPQQIADAIVAGRARDWAEQKGGAGNDILVTAMPFRVRMAGEPVGSMRDSSQMGRPRFKIAQVALYLHGKEDIFRPLRRNLVISIVSAIALVTSMILAYLLWPRYMRGRHLEEQVALARTVQQEFLPRECTACERLDFAVEFVPFSEVGGDYYDLFATADGKIHMVLGDVSGKGLPAALLMGLLQGAVRSAAEMSTLSEIAGRVAKLNELLRARTDGSRFVSLFWGCLDRSDGSLCYVNAGHLPPLLLRRGTGSEVSAEKLETGGPVLGLLPGSSYEEGRVSVREGDVLAMYSDGLTEANNLQGQEFGEERLLRALQAPEKGSAAEICRHVLAEMKSFTGAQPPRDDLTLLVIRLVPVRT